MAPQKKWLRRARRVALWGSILTVLAVVAINAVLNLPMVKGRLVRALPAGLGDAVEIGWVSFFPPSSLRVGEVVLGDAENPSLSLSVTARLRIWETLSGWATRRSIVFGEVRSKGAQFRFGVPEPDLVPVATLASPEAPVAPPRPLPPPSPPAPRSGGGVAPPRIVPEEAAPPVSPAPAVADNLPLRVDFDGVVFEEASFVIEDGASGREVAKISGVRVAISSAGSGGASGEVRIGAVEFAGETVGEAATARVAVTKAGLDVTEIALPVPGGELTGRLLVGGGEGRPFQMELRGVGLDVIELAKRFDRGPELLAGGGVDVIMRMRGLASKPGAVRARARVAAPDLDLGERGRADVSATLDFMAGRLLVSDVRASADGKRLRAVGRVARDGSLRLNTRLYAAGASHVSIAGRAATLREGGGRPQFLTLPDTNWHYLDFRVAGPVAAPRADLWGDGGWMPVVDLAERLLEPPAPTPAGNLIPVATDG